MLYCFYHNYGIIYNNPNGQYQPKHGEGIDGKP